MQRPPDTEIGSRALHTRRHSAEAPADMQRLEDINDKQRTLEGCRRSLIVSVRRAWAVLVTALAVATLLIHCFRACESWRNYGVARRRLASGGFEPPDDPDTRAIVDLCLEMDDIRPTSYFPALQPVAAPTTVEAAISEEEPVLTSLGPAQQAIERGVPSRLVGAWGFQPQSLTPPFPYILVATSTPTKVAAPTLVAPSPPLYQVALQRGSYSGSAGTRVVWAYGRGLRSSNPWLLRARTAGYTIVDADDAAVKGFSESSSPDTVHGGSSEQTFPSERLERSTAILTDRPQMSPSSPTNASPHLSPQISPSTELSEGADPGADSDPEEGPSSGPMKSSTGTVPSATLRIVKKRRGAPQTSSDASVVAMDGSGPAPKRSSGSSEKEVSSPAVSRRVRLPTVACPEEHLFYRLPKLAPYAIRTDFSSTLAFSNTRLLGVPYYGLLALRNFLSKEAVCSREVTTAVRAAERLVNCLIHFHYDPLTHQKPHEACRLLGIRYLAFDALLSLSELLGSAMHRGEWWDRLAFIVPSDVRFKAAFRNIPRRHSNALLAIRLSEAIGQLKQGVRPSATETVDLKQWLLCSVYSPAYFKQSRWAPWREDDACSARSAEQQWIDPSSSSPSQENQTD